MTEFSWLDGSKLLNRRKSIDPAKIRDLTDLDDDSANFTASAAAPNLVNIKCQNRKNTDSTMVPVICPSIVFFVAKPSRTLLFHEGNSEPDRCGVLYLCQEHT
jgi:hypothetical protein